MSNKMANKTGIIEEAVSRIHDLNEIKNSLLIENKKQLELEARIEFLNKQLNKEIKRLKGIEKSRDYHKRRYGLAKNSRSWRYTAFARGFFRLFSKKNKKLGDPHKSNNQPQKKVVSHHRMKRDERKVDELRRKLLNLGFTTKAYTELYDLVKNTQRPYLRRLAAWELVLWHADKYTKEDAKKCLQFIRVITDGEDDNTRLRQAAIMEAECLEILGENDKAKMILEGFINKEPNVDLYLAYANLMSQEHERIKWINSALALCNIGSISTIDDFNLNMYDRLRADVNRSLFDNDPKVTVIVPVYNASDVIQTALDSILNQTWTNLEILVVDDCSTDHTVEIVTRYEQKDKRVRLIRSKENGGPYVARNLALMEATGEYVTCNDADDWSHPSKIEVQVRHLIENKHVVGNTSEQARATNDLKFYRRGKPGSYVFGNMSSFMFRREKVLEKIGYWDSVRFGADSEFIRRIKKIFGADSIVDLKTGPLSFQRQTSGSLTGNSAFGYHGYFMGARKEYFEAYIQYHNTGDLKYEFPQSIRPFAVPEPMLPNREKVTRRHFDVIIVSDFRLDGGSTLSSVEEIKAHIDLGLRTGLVQMSRYDYNVRKKINPKIRELLNGDTVQMIVYGEKVSCDELILRYPPILQEYQRFVPDVEAGRIRVIINQTPLSDYGENGVIRYTLKQAQTNLAKYFTGPTKWYPIGPLVRKTLLENHSDEINAINLADTDWLNIINLNEWKREIEPSPHDKIRIGRHSRDHHVKWPGSREELLEVYPDDEMFEVHVLGGAQTPKAVLGYFPENWIVHEFNEISPKEFLSKLDVFVYYTHQDWVESFGRVIIEAMAVGVPVILPHSYYDLFKEAAIYAYPNEVKEKILKLVNDPENYRAQVELAFEYVEKHFGYKMHEKRIRSSKL